MGCEVQADRIICTRGGRDLGRCVVCRRAPATLLCDGLLEPMTFGQPKPKTCDAALCRRCATPVRPNVDACPDCLERLPGLRQMAERYAAKLAAAGIRGS